MKRVAGAALCAVLAHSAILGVVAPRVAPAPFTLAAPANSAAGLTLTPSFSWTDSADETFYNFQLSTESGFSSGLLVSVNLGQNVVTYDLPSYYLTANVTYYWKVVAYDGVGNTTASNAPFTFTTGPFAPFPFTLSSPANGAGTVPLVPTLSWSDGGGETGYLVEIDTENTFAVPLTHTANLPVNQNFYSVPGAVLTTGTQYFWRVTATSAAGPTLASNAPFSFTTNTPPTPFALSTPADLATGISLAPTLTWVDSTNEDSYLVELSSEASFTTGLLVSQFVSAGSTSFPVPAGPLGANTTYFWRVTASNNVGSIPASTGPFRFTTGSFAPTSFTLSFPADAATGLGLQPQLIWTNAGGETGYTLEVDTENTFVLPLIYTTALGQDVTSYVIPPTFLSPGIQYFWRVIATNGAGSTLASNVFFSFTTNFPPSAFVQIGPADFSTVPDLTPTLQWNDASNEADYLIQISTESTFSSGLVYATTVSANTVSLNVPSGPLLPATQYLWRVIAENNASSTVASNAYFTFTTANVAPTAFSLSFPADLATGQTLEPILYWTNSVGETGYTLEVDTENTFAIPLTYMTPLAADVTAHALPAATLAPGIQYFWRVIATNAGGNTPATPAYFAFTTNTPPTGFTLIGPGDLSTGVPLEPTFQWTDASNESSYTIEFSTEDTFGPGYLWGDTVTANTTSYPAPPVFAANTTYFWRVRADNNVAQVFASNSSFSFTTGNFAPNGFTIFSPLNGAVGEGLEPPLQWYDAVGETSYTIEIDTENTFALPLTHTASLPLGTTYYYVPPATLAVGTPYFWRVIAVNVAGSTTASNAPFSFTTNVVPAPFNLTSPPDTTLAWSMTPNLIWTDSSGEDYYEILVSTEPTFTTGLILSDTRPAGVTSYPVPALLLAPGTLYYWRVKAINNVAQVLATNSPSQFTTTTVVPPGFPLLSPADGSTGISLTPLLTWSQTTGEDSYTVEIDTDSLFSAPLTYSTILPAGQISFNVPVGPLAPGVQYYWRVIAMNTFGQTIAGNAPISFTTDVPPASFNLSAPSNGAAVGSITPTLSWVDTAGETSYRIEISSDIGFSYFEHQTVIGANNSSYPVPAGPLTTSTTYYWRVVAVNPVGQTIATNAPFSFDTGNPPPTAFTLVAPGTGSTGVNLTPILQWTDAGGETGYTVQVDTENTFSVPIAEQVGLSAGTTSHMVNIGSLSAGTLYYWRVIATNAGGNTTASNAPFTFTTLSSPPSAFTLTLPADGATGLSLTPALLWADASGETGYTLEVDTDNLFSLPLAYSFGLPTNSTSHSVPGGNLLANTTYFWRVIASNGAGNTVSSPAYFSFSTGAPPGAFTLSGPASGATGVVTTPTLTWADATGETGYIIELDTTITFPGPLYSNSVAANVTNFAVPRCILTGGTQYYWRIIAYNGIGSVVASNAPFSFTTTTSDATPPLAGAVNDGSGADIDYQASLATIQANWNGFSDPDSGITAYEWAIGTTPGGTQMQAFTGVGLSTSATNSSLSLSGGQTYYVSVRATNGGSLTVTASSDGVQVDVAAPTGTSVVINGGAAATNATVVTLALTATDAASGVAQMRFSNDGLSFSPYEPFAPSKAWILVAGDGPKTVYVQFVDAVGNTAPVVTDGITLDTAPPNAPTPLAPADSASFVGGSVNFSWTNESGSGAVAYRLQVDNSAGFSSPEVDAPGLAVTSFTPGSALAVGSYSWRVIASDAAGNTAASAVFTFTVQTTPPATPTGLLASVSGADVTFNGTVTDPDLDPVRLDVEIQPVGTPFTGTPTAFSAFIASGGVASRTVLGLANGSYDWRARAVDLQGFASAWFDIPGSPDFAVSVAPNNPPAAPAAAGLEQLTNALVPIPVGNVTNETLVKCRATVSDPDGDATRLEIEFLPTSAAFTGVPTHSSALAPNGAAVVITASGLANGTWHWRARFVDASGAASAWTSFGGNADGAPDVQVSVPVTSPLSPASLAVSVAGTSSSVTLQALLVDPGDTIQLQVEVEPNPGTFGDVPDAGSPFVASGGTGTVLLAGLAAGNYIWQARAADSAGNISAWVAGPGFSVAPNTPPSAPSSPGAFKAGGATAVPLTNETLVVFQAGVSDPDSDPVQLEVQVQPGGLSFAGAFAASGGTASVAATLPPGSHTWQVFARDIRGAASALAAGPPFTISTSAPVVSAVSAVPATGTAPFNVDFSASISAANAVAGIGWDFDGDGSIDFNGAGSATATRVYSEPGVYPAKIYVTDIAGNTTVAGVTITANAPPSPLSTVAADKSAGPAPLAVNFSATLAGASRVVALSWDFDGDGNPDAVTAGPNATHTYFAPGTYPARLRVVYDDATYETVPLAPAIVVTNPPGGLSTVRIVRAFADSDNDLQRGATEAILGSNLVSGLGGSTVTVQAGQRLGMEGSTTLAAGLEVHAWEWDFTGSGEIDRGSATSSTGTHVYESAGNYVATLHLTDRVAATGLPRARASTSVNVRVLPPTAENPRVFFTQPAYRGRTIGGNCFTFEVTAVPATVIDYPTVRVQFSLFSSGPWTDLPVSSVALGRPAVRLTVNLASLIPGTLTGGTPYYWRCRATTLGGVPVTIDSDAPDQQGPFPLVPLAAGAQIQSDCTGPLVTTLELDPTARNEAAAPGQTRVVIPFEGLPPPPTPADALQILLRNLDSNPAGTSASVADGINCTMAFVSGFREVKVTDGSGNAFSLLKPARVRIYYNDADDDGFLDGTSQNELDLRIFRFVNGRWAELEDVIRHPGENWIEGTTTGFSFFSAGAENVSGGGTPLIARGDHCSSGAAAAGTNPILPAALGALLLAGAWVARRRRGPKILACLLVLSGASGTVFAQEPNKQEAIEQEKRKALGAGDRGEAVGDDLLCEYGAWSRSAYYGYRRGDGRKVGWFDEDIRVWLDLGYLEAHRLYLRAREEVLLYSGGDDPEGGHDTQGGRPHMDLAFYEVGNATLRARAGRQYIGLGIGFVYNQVGDGLSAEARLDPFRLSAFGARSVHSQDDIDRSRPNFDDSRRFFAGGQLDIDVLGDHKPYVIAMVQRDHNGDERATQEFTFDSEYLGAGIAGQVGTYITYAAEGVLETGSRFATGQVDDPEKIRAMAFLARGSLFLKEDSSLVLRGEYIFGSGDGDRSSAVNTVNGNTAGTDDESFLGFGYLFTGLALSPRPINLHILHGGFAATLHTDEAGTTAVDAGIDAFIFRKHRKDGGIDDPFAAPFSGFISRDIGEEIDLYLNWKALSDLGFTLRYGAFIPGLAYKSSDPYRYYFGVGMVYSF